MTRDSCGSVLDASRLLVLVVDRAGLIRHANQAISRTAGLPPPACPCSIWELTNVAPERDLLKAGFSPFRPEAFPSGVLFHLTGGADAAVGRLGRPAARRATRRRARGDDRRRRDGSDRQPSAAARDGGVPAARARSSAGDRLDHGPRDADDVQRRGRVGCARAGVGRGGADGNAGLQLLPDRRSHPPRHRLSRARAAGRVMRPRR